MGGYTHANAWQANKILHDVYSYDFTSSYPAVMITEQFPMSKSVKVTDDVTAANIDEYMEKYCCLFDVCFVDIYSIFDHDQYISASRCWGKEKCVVNNGRLTSGHIIYTTLTEQDYMIIRSTYKWRHMYISNFRYYLKNYLPTDFVKSILHLYVKKTELKNVKGKEVEYLYYKELLNSCYGMSVTDIIRASHPYDDNQNEWGNDLIPDLEKEITKYNKSASRFLYYPWGVWVTAYARRNLWSGILSIGEDYVYSDTDSVKILNRDKHLNYFVDYNKTIDQMMHAALDYHNIDFKWSRPKTIKGIEKPLGHWDYEGKYTRFKTLGAKRYMTETYDGVSITTAGLNKNIAAPYICRDWNYSTQDRKEHNSPFDRYAHNMYIPAEHTGKNTHTYIDYEVSGTVTDYLGTPAEYDEQSCIHLEAAPYDLSLSQEYYEYLIGMEPVEK
jgi:hypothetical protein